MTRVLLVDDHTAVASGIASALGISGFEVRLASSVVDALTALNGERPDALVTDWHLPDGTGADVICLCQNRYPNVPTLIQTASPESVTTPGPPILAKPYPIQALVEWLGGVG